jgi:hypothetical protein
MSARTTVMVWVAAIVCVFVALAVRTGDHSAESIDALAVPGVPAVDTLATVEVHRGDTTWTFERDDAGTWWQRTPFVQRMDAARLLALPELLQTLRAVAQVELDARQAGMLGLTMPGGTGEDLGLVRLRDGEGNGVDVHIGQRGIGGRGWIRVGDGTEALVVDDDLHAIVLQEPPSSWRDARLLPGTDADATTVEWLLNGETIHLERSGRTWRFVSPVQTRADTAGVTGHLAQLARARFQSVLLDEPTDPAAFGLAPPIASITVHRSGMMAAHEPCS